ncbi:MAG: YeeE/YedE family protein [Proteobacteria bacterium]|nr:YeeE/YedE family protein [Pseudomonadota bacterium]
MIRPVLCYLFGLVFGAGMTISGMINPSKVLNFFDVTGTWDPSLAFVMGGALLVTATGYWLARKRGAPLFDRSFHLPLARVVDFPLVIGAAVFGIGWGIAGFCPGSAIAALGLGRGEPIIFVSAMVVGLLGGSLLRAALHSESPAPEEKISS